MLSQGQNECWTQWTKKTLKVWVASISDLPKLSSVLTFHSSHKELSFHQGFAPRQNSSPIQLDLPQTYCNCSGLTTASIILKCHCSQKFNSSLAHGSGSALSVSETNTTFLPPGSPGTGSSFIPDSVVPSLSFSFPLAAWDLKNRQKFENKDEKSRIRRYLHHSSFTLSIPDPFLQAKDEKLTEHQTDGTKFANSAYRRWTRSKATKTHP